MNYVQFGCLWVTVLVSSGRELDMRQSLTVVAAMVVGMAVSRFGPLDPESTGSAPNKTEPA
jgi:hypothetical protein